MPIDLPTESDDVTIILVRPKYDGNIGAVARTVLNFGITDLRIVGRDNDWSEDTRNRAKHAQDVLDSCKTFENSVISRGTKIILSKIPKLFSLSVFEELPRLIVPYTLKPLLIKN